MIFRRQFLLAAFIFGVNLYAAPGRTQPSPPTSAAPEASSPPADAAPSGTPQPPSPEVVAPQVLESVDAVYPEGSQAQGTVVLRVTLNPEGSVEAAEVAQSVDPELDKAALTAIMGWKFAPATRQGIAVAARIQVPFTFTPPAPAPPPPVEPPASPASQAPSALGRAPAPVPGRPTPPKPTSEQTVTVSGQKATRVEQRSASDFAVHHDLLETAPRHEGVEVLRSAPGLYIARSEGAAVAHRYMLRGFDSEHGQDIEFHVAGIPINLPSHIHGQGYADLGFLVAETVDELRVTEGVHDPKQGDFAVAGSLDLTLGVARRGFLSRTAYGSFGTFRQLALWAPPGELRDSFGAVAFNHTDGFGQNRRGESVSAIVQQGYSLDHWRLRSVGILYGARADMAGVVRSDDVSAGRLGFYDVYAYPTARAQNAFSGRLMLGLFGQYRGDDGDSAQVGVWVSDDHFRLQENLTGFEQRSQTLANVSGRGDLIEQLNYARSAGVTAQYRAPVRALGELIESYLELGLDARTDDIEQAQNLLDATVHDQTWDRRVDARVLASDIGGYGDLDLHLSEIWKLRLGYRADGLLYSVDDRLGNRAPATRSADNFIVGFRRSAMGIAAGPRVSSDVDATPWLSVHASYGEGYRSPEARLLDDGEQTPFTKVHSADLGTRFHFGERYEVALSGYYTTLSDDVAFDADEGRMERIGRTRRVGGVVHAEARPVPGLVAAASVTYVDAELLEPPPQTPREPDPPFRAGQNLPFVPPIVGRLDVGYRRALGHLDTHKLSGRVGGGLSVVSARPLPYGAFASPFALADLAAGLGLEPLELGIEVFNLLDAQYAAVEYSFVSNWNPDAPASRVAARHSAAGSPRTILATLELHL